MAKQKGPRFVNLSSSTVMVFDITKRNVSVAPWHTRDLDRTAIHVVEGAHYQQFVSGRGPLYPFPASSSLPASVMVGPYGLHVSKRHPHGGALQPDPVAVATLEEEPVEDPAPEDEDEDPEGGEGGEGEAGGDAEDEASAEDTGDEDPDGEEVDEEEAPAKPTGLLSKMLGKGKKKAAKKKKASKKRAVAK